MIIHIFLYAFYHCIYYSITFSEYTKLPLHKGFGEPSGEWANIDGFVGLYNETGTIMILLYWTSIMSGREYYDTDGRIFPLDMRAMYF